MTTPASLFDLTGRTALITGAAGGLGSVFAHALAGAGADVALVGRRAEPLEQLAAEVAAASGRRAVALAADVTDEAAVRALVGAAAAALGPIDILVNSAGINIRRPGVDYDLADWQRVLQVNLTGPFLCLRAVVPMMRERNYGRIVNIASIAGKEGNPNASAYSSAKAGLIALTKSLAKELATTEIKVNCITPAAVETDIFKQMTETHIKFMLSKIPMARFGKVEEVAGMICWLASEEMSFSTGAVFDISGGRATY